MRSKTQFSWGIIAAHLGRESTPVKLFLGTQVMGVKERPPLSPSQHVASRFASTTAHHKRVESRKLHYLPAFKLYGIQGAWREHEFLWHICASCGRNKDQVWHQGPPDSSIISLRWLQEPRFTFRWLDTRYRSPRWRVSDSIGLNHSWRRLFKMDWDTTSFALMRKLLPPKLCFRKYQKPPRRPESAVPVKCVPLLILCALK